METVRYEFVETSRVTMIQVYQIKQLWDLLYLSLYMDDIYNSYPILSVSCVVVVRAVEEGESEEAPADLAAELLRTTGSSEVYSLWKTIRVDY